MTIEWNKVTWYSKLAAMLLFVGVFWLGFWLGTMKVEKIYIEVPHLIRGHGQQLLIEGNAAPINTATSFVGHILRGEIFQKDIGGDLLFRLTPNENGWDANIYSKDAKQNDFGFASIATPPFHGINPLQIEGWHFRNKDNTASNDGSINAPQEVRDFSFVLSKGDADKMAIVVQQFTSGKTLDFSPNVSAEKGELLITNFKLGNLQQGSQAWIESMDFTVNLHFPRTK